MFRTLLVPIIFLAVLSCEKKSDSSAEAQTDSNIAMVNESDGPMNRAIAEAQRTLPLFLERLASPVSGDSNFVVKVKVAESSGVEHLWVSGITRSDSLFSGIVDNEPQFVSSVVYKGKINFTQNDISDWAFTDSLGVRQGSFTVKVLLKGMQSQDAEAYRKLFGWEDTVGNGFQSK